MIFHMLQIYEDQFKSHDCGDAIPHFRVVAFFKEKREDDGVNQAKGVGA